MMKKRCFAVLTVLLAAALLLGLTSCKKSTVKTDEGKLLTAHAWETNYGTHSEVRFETDGTMTVTVDNVGDMVDVPGKWVLKGTTLTATIEKNFDQNGDLADKPTKTVYTWADYMTDAIIDDGDQSIADAREKYEKGTEWYVSENYLYFGGSVWVPLKH